MFNIVTGLAKAAIGVVTLPVDIVADAVTMGGELTGNGSTYTGNKIEKIMEGLDEATS